MQSAEPSEWVRTQYVAWLRRGGPDVWYWLMVNPNFHFGRPPTYLTDSDREAIINERRRLAQ